MLVPGSTCQQAFYLSGPGSTACSMRLVLEKIQEIVPELDICCGQIIAGQYQILVFSAGGLALLSSHPHSRFILRLS